MTDKESVKDRLILFLKHLNMGQTAFEEQVGLSRGFISNTKKSIGSENILKISSRYPEISIEWLVSGRGAMLKETNALPDPIEGIPLIPVDAIAGLGKGDIAGIKYEDCSRYYVPEFSERGVEFLIRVSGSSMYPKYANGDILACKKIHEVLFIQWGKVYVIESKTQGPLVKRLFEHDDEFVQCVSDNKEHYPPFLLPKSDIRSLSIVVGVIRLD